MSDQFTIKLHGVRGSIPAPLSSDDIEGKVKRALQKASPEDISDDEAIDRFITMLPRIDRGTVGGNSTCIQITVGGHELFFDGGSGCFRMASELFAGPFGRGRGEAHWFITHTHHDHLVGIPMFGPLYIPGNQFHFISPIEDLEHRFQRYYHTHFFPVPFQALGSKIDFITLEKDQAYILKPIENNENNENKEDNIVIRWLPNDHPGASYSYRIEYKGKIVVFSTDAEYKQLSFQALKPVEEFFRDADVLIFDAQYAFTESVAMKRDWGHSSSMVGIDLALDAAVKKLLLFHHDPTFSDETLEKNLVQARKYLQNMEPGSPLEVDLAIEGDIISLL